MLISSYSCFLGLRKSNGHSREEKTDFTERFPCAIASSSGLKFALGLRDQRDCNGLPWGTFMYSRTSIVKRGLKG